MKAINLLADVVRDFGVVSVSPLHARLLLLPSRFFPRDEFVQAVCRSLVCESGNLEKAVENLPASLRGSMVKDGARQVWRQSPRVRAFLEWARGLRQPRPVRGLLEWKGGAS